MPIVRVAYLGFGSVNTALHALLDRRRDALAKTYDIEIRVTGVASRTLGWRADAGGLDPYDPPPDSLDDVDAWLDAARPDVVFEATPLDPLAGLPALDYLRAVLAHGAHAISANKGPVVHGYRELAALAAKHGRGYRFESAVMDGAPLFSLVRDCLPLAGLHTIRGVFTSTATVILEAVERGLSFADGVAEAQRLGIAEADPRYDVDGWDSAVKLCAIANVLFDADLRPGDVARRGIGELDARDVRAASAEGRPLRLVGEVSRTANGDVSAAVGPARCSADDPIGIVRGATLALHYEADVFPGGLVVTSRHPDPTTTAYGMLADLISLRSFGR